MRMERKINSEILTQWTLKNRNIFFISVAFFVMGGARPLGACPV